MSSAVLQVVIRTTFLALLLFQDEAAADNSQHNYGAKNGEYYMETFANVSPGNTVDGSTTVEGVEKKHQQTTGLLFDAYRTHFVEADKTKDRVLLRRDREEATSAAMVGPFRQCIRDALAEEAASNGSLREPKKRRPNRRKKKDRIMTVRKLQDDGDYNADVEGSMSEDTVSEAGEFVELYNDLGNIFNDYDNEKVIEYGLEEDDDDEDGDDDGDDEYHLEEAGTGYSPTGYKGENKLDDQDTELPTDRSDDLEAKVRQTITLCYCLNLNSLVVMHATVNATSSYVDDSFETVL